MLRTLLKKVYIAISAIIALAIVALSFIFLLPNKSVDEDASRQAITQTPYVTPSEVPSETPQQNEFIIIFTKSISNGVQGSWYEAFKYPFFTGGTNAKNVFALNNEISQWIDGFRIRRGTNSHSDEENDFPGEDESEIYYEILYDGTENFGFDKDNNKLIIEYGEYSLSDYATWKCEGTYFVSEDVIYLDLNTENNSDSILFWRNGEMEVAYLDVETETIHYRTIWSAENDEVVYCNFK